jgi:hypothetical protein
MSDIDFISLFNDIRFMNARNEDMSFLLASVLAGEKNLPLVKGAKLCKKF